LLALAARPCPPARPACSPRLLARACMLARVPACLRVPAGVACVLAHTPACRACPKPRCHASAALARACRQPRLRPRERRGVVRSLPLPLARVAPARVSAGGVRPRPRLPLARARVPLRLLARVGRCCAGGCVGLRSVLLAVGLLVLGVSGLASLGSTCAALGTARAGRACARLPSLMLPSPDLVALGVAVPDVG
jgi:hypothetical protein